MRAVASVERAVPRVAPAALTITALLALGACRGQPDIEWVPFVDVHGMLYDHAYALDDAVAPGALGPVVERVRHTVSGHVFNPHYKPRDGDAAFLAVGTDLRGVPGFPTAARVAAVVDGHVQVYVAEQELPAKATTTTTRPR